MLTDTMASPCSWASHRGLGASCKVFPLSGLQEDKLL